ncbi:MAG: hypothetical protein CW338_02345 [Clostridiales bacterium]|nr:hypothetical protein [Clostridiales bacterium]
MSSRLIIDCCPREEDSATRRLYRAHPEFDAADNEILYLSRKELLPLSGVEADARARLSALGPEAMNGPLFDLARQFAATEEIWIAAPYWDLSFPSLLKVYLERVSVVGVTFCYEDDPGIPKGLCRARRIRYFCTAGGPVLRPHQGVEYVRALGAMFGIPQVEEFTVENMDTDPRGRDAVLTEGISRMREGMK